MEPDPNLLYQCQFRFSREESHSFLGVFALGLYKNGIKSISALSYLAHVLLCLLTNQTLIFLKDYKLAFKLIDASISRSC